MVVGKQLCFKMGRRTSVSINVLYVIKTPLPNLSYQMQHVHTERLLLVMIVSLDPELKSQRKPGMLFYTIDIWYMHPRLTTKIYSKYDTIHACSDIVSSFRHCHSHGLKIVKTKMNIESPFLQNLLHVY